MPNSTGTRPGRAGRWRLLLAVAALTGCSLIIQEPMVRVAEVCAASLGLTGGTLRVVVEVENPNSFGLKSELFTFRLELAEEPGVETTTWRTLFDGEHPGMVQIPSQESTRIELEVPFQYSSVGMVVGRLLRQGELEYRFSGSLQFSLPVGHVLVPFDERGTFRP